MHRTPTGARSRLLTVLLAVAMVGAACGGGTSGQASTERPAGGRASASNVTAAVQTLLKEGINQADANMLEQAATTFNDVLLLDPKNTYAFYNLGLLAQEQNKTATALSYYNKALSADRTYTPAMYNKAIILEGSDLAAALALYKQIVKLNPKASTAYLRMAFVYSRQGQSKEADAAKAKAVALDPSLSKYPLPAKCSNPKC